MTYTVSSRGIRRAAAGVAATLTLSLLVGAAPADAVVKDIDSFGLSASGRAWSFQNSDSGFGYEDGAIFTSRYGSDAFDGALVLLVDGSYFWDEDLEGDFDASTNTMSVGPMAMGDLRVSREETAKGAYARSLVRFKNVGATTLDVPLTMESDLGSDGAGVVTSSSSGVGTTLETSDRWLVTAEPGATGFGADPALAFVLFGKKAKARPTAIAGAPAEGWVSVEYTLTVPAGATRYLLFYTEMHGKPREARKSMAKYDATGLNPTLLAGIPKKVRSKVANWSL